MKKENETFYDRKNFIAIVVASAAAVLIKQYILGCMMLEDTFWNGFFIHMLVFIPIYILLLTVLRRFKKE